MDSLDPKNMDIEESIVYRVPGKRFRTNSVLLSSVHARFLQPSRALREVINRG